LWGGRVINYCMVGLRGSSSGLSHGFGTVSNWVELVRGEILSLERR